MAYQLTATLRLVDRLTGPLRNATNSVRTAGGIFASQMLGISASLGGVAAAAAGVSKAMDFEAQLSSIQALTGASSAEMKQMSDLALKMGAQTKYSALEAAKGIEELLKSGLSPAAVQAGGLEAALNLATAGGLDLTEAAETMSTSMNAFKKDGMTAAEVSNILAGAANASATDVHNLGYALASVGGVADMVGLSFKDVNAAMGLLANSGLKSGSDAGTSFKSMLMYLQPQTEKAGELFTKLGIGVGKANKFFKDGKIKDLAGIAQVLQEAFKGMSEQARTDAFLEMFGTDGVKAASTLYKEGAAGVQKMHEEMSKVTALDVAKKKMDNAKGAVEQLKGAIETMSIVALMPLMPIIKAIATKMADMMSGASGEKLIAWGGSLVDVLKVVYNEVSFVHGFITQNWGTIGPIVAGVTAAFAAYKVAMIALNTWTILVTASQFLLATAMAMTPFGWAVIAIGALVAAGVALYQNWDTVKEMAVKVGNAIMNNIVWAVNAAIGKINDLIGVLNEIPGVEIPPITYSMQMPGGGEVPAGPPIPGEQPSSRAGGLPYVPYDGFLVRAHRGETILPKTQADEYRNGKASTAGVTITGNTFHVRQESDIQDIALRLAQLINEKG